MSVYMEDIADLENIALRLPLKIIRDITDDFSKDRMIGEGGFGVVYKGIFGDGNFMAVRKLYPIGEIDDEQLQDKIVSLMKIQHPNIVRLLGYCNEKEQVLLPYNGRHVYTSEITRALCFEYMQNGSLDRHNSDISFGLDWNTRYRIIKGICEGLKYLHEGSSSPIFHLNLKPSNILFDQNMMPKISDFGVSRLMGEENIKRMGTMGYMAPEFVERQVISHKSDIFSLGIIIMKLVTGSKPGPNNAYSNKFVEPVLEKWRERLQKTVNGTSVERDYQQVRKCVEIALKCVECDRHERPSIGEILNRLDEIETLIPEEVRAIQNRLDSRKYMLLDIDPLELYFPLMLKGRKKDSSSCLLKLKNMGDDRVAFMLVANIPKRYLTKKSICGVVLPRSANTLALTKLKQKPPTSSDNSDFFTLYSAMVGQYDLLDVDKDYTHYNNFFKKSMQYGDKVQVVKLKVICDRPPAKSTAALPEDRGRGSPRNCKIGNFFTLKTREEGRGRKI